MDVSRAREVEWSAREPDREVRYGDEESTVVCVWVYTHTRGRSWMFARLFADGRLCLPGRGSGRIGV